MFKEHCQHERRIKKSYIQNTENKKPNIYDRIRMTGKGATVGSRTNRLDKKVRKCYPRGKAWLRIVDLHTAYWCTNHA